MKKNLAIVRGNDFILKVPVRNIIFYRESSGEMVKATHPVDLGNCEFLKVHLVDDCEERTSVPFEIQGSDLKIKICGCTECGWYGIEVIYKLNSYNYRSYERRVFKIVPNNGRSFVSGEQYQGEHSYQVDTMWSLCSVDEIDLKRLIEEESIKFTEEQIDYRVKENMPYIHGKGNNSAILAGSGNNAEGGHAHSEGHLTQAPGSSAHSEGFMTAASGSSAHSEGQLCAATAPASHAGGQASNARGTSSFVHGQGLVANHVGEFALGILNDPDAEGGDGEDDYLIGSIGGGYTKDGITTHKNLLEIWRNGSIYLQFLGEKTKLQDVIFLFVKLIKVLYQKEVITLSDMLATQSDIEVIKNDDTIVGLEVKPYGMVPEDEVGETLYEDDEDLSPAIQSEYSGSIGTWDDTQEANSVILDLGSQSHMTGDANYHYYPIDEWNLREDLYDTLQTIWESGIVPVLNANLLFDGHIQHEVRKEMGGAFSAYYFLPNGSKVEIYVPEAKPLRYINVYRYNEQYYYNGSIGNWE